MKKIIEKIIVLGILFCSSISFGATLDEILKGTQGFIQTQEKSFSSYTARVRVEMDMDHKEGKGSVIGTGTFSFERPDKITQNIEEMKVDGKNKKMELHPPFAPFELYEIFNDKFQRFEYSGENETTHILKVISKKGSNDTVSGRIEIDKQDFAVLLIDVEISNVNLGLFFCKTFMKERFIKIGECWVPKEMFIKAKMRMLLKRVNIKTQWFFNDYRINK